MQQIRTSGGREQAATSLEYAGLAMVVAVLLGGVAVGARGGGDDVGGTVAARVEELVIEAPKPRRWRDAREVRGGGGSVPVRVSRDELRMSPVLDPLSLWDGSIRRAGTVAGTSMEIEATACAVCAAVEWSYGRSPAAERGSERSRAGLGAAFDVAGRLALVSAELTARAERDVPGGAAFAQGRLRGTIGGEADASIAAQLDRGTVDVELDAGAMAGAVARAEARAGIDLLGVAIRQSGRVEGWAGAGVRGTAGVRTGGGVTSWRFGWGGALGLGGAAEWSGSVDASSVPATHRRLARDALVASLRVAGIHVPPIPSIR
jgi:hypothetical protein